MTGTHNEHGDAWHDTVEHGQSDQEKERQDERKASSLVEVVTVVEALVDVTPRLGGLGGARRGSPHRGCNR